MEVTMGEHGFKRGHAKVGGRKRGTPNARAASQLQARLYEAADRVGFDGNGKDGLIGYFRWLAIYHAPAFSRMLACILPLEHRMVEPDPLRTMEEIHREVRAFVERERADFLEQPLDDVDMVAPWRWTGRGQPIGPLMHLAVNSPDEFAGLVVDAFFPAYPKSRPSRQHPREERFSA
jgi:hypothetical protein